MHILKLSSTLNAYLLITNKLNDSHEFQFFFSLVIIKTYKPQAKLT